MKYRVTIEIIPDPDDEDNYSHCNTVTGDDLSWALWYAIRGVHASRFIELLASVVDHDDHVYLSEEKGEVDFVDAATAVVEAWNKYDAEILGEARRE